MTRFWGALVTLVLCSSITETSTAGPNAGGALFVHANPSIIFTGDDSPYIGQSQLSDCELATTNIPGGMTYVWFVSAVFASDAVPRLAGVSFGVDYPDDTIFLVDFGPSGDFELATGAWPAPGEGTAVTFAEARTDGINEVYWFAGYEYYNNDVSFDAIAHPTQGANFADDSVPSQIDPIAELGRLGFNNDPGYGPCPTESVDGACCLSDGTCQMSSMSECEDAGGEYLGDGSGCDPDPCQIVPTVETSWGKLKTVYGDNTKN